MATSAALGQGRGARGICAGIKLHVRSRSLGANRFQRRSRKPDVLLPISLALARRHDGVSARRIDLRRTAAGNHAHIGVRADDRDAVDLRQRRAEAARSSFFSSTVLSSAICCATSNPPITSTTLFCGGSSTTPVANIDAQDAVHVIIELGRRNFARLDCLLQIVAVEDFAGLFVIEAGG